jgi:hypothetical protein
MSDPVRWDPWPRRIRTGMRESIKNKAAATEFAEENVP